MKKGWEIKSFQNPSPPLPEQRRIVAALDEAFAGIVQGRAHAQKNIQNAREILERHLNTVISQRTDGRTSFFS